MSMSDLTRSSELGNSIVEMETLALLGCTG
eukprot:COSAG06_NODE_325_length_17475_cov_13.436982_10_plen_30_part_00